MLGAVFIFSWISKRAFKNFYCSLDPCYDWEMHIQDKEPVTFISDAH